MFARRSKLERAESSHDRGDSVDARQTASAVSPP
jgi:hypothetical protein